jgi:hypothetical protein
LILSTLKGFLDKPGQQGGARKGAQGLLPPEQMRNIDAVLGGSAISYRDALIIQLAYGLCVGGHLDLTKRHPGTRGKQGVAGQMGSFLSQSHIRSVQDAYQNIAKNTPNLTRGNFAEFDSFLRWVSGKQRCKEELRAAFNYCCAAVAATARPVRRMPELNVGVLTFGRVMEFLAQLFGVGSQGAYEQFAVAALLHALLAQVRADVYRVETKNLNASDRSSRAAGDIQILAGNRVVEAYEVSAAGWENKVDGAERTIADHDLSRLHIVASLPDTDWQSMLKALRGHREDVSVLDVREFASALVSALTRQSRAAALERLYEFLDRYQPDIDKVNRYVEMVIDSGLTRAG